MNRFPRREIIDVLRETYPFGTRVRLISMNDPYTKLQPGDEGTVINVDAIGTIHVQWDSGSTLGVAYGEDRVTRI